MAVDASIYGAIRAPQAPNQLEQFAQMQQIQGAQNQNRLADLMFSEKQRESAGDNELARLLAAGKAPQDVATGLAGAGYGRQSMAYTKAQQDSQKVKGEIAKDEAAAKKTGLEAMNLALTQHRDMLNTITDPATAKQWIAAAYQNPDTKAIFEKMGPMETALQRFDQGVTSPEAFAKWKQQASLNAQELVKYTTPDANATLSATTSRQNNEASNATSRANNAASVGATIRGQNLTDARSREANQSGKIPPGYRATASGGLEAIPGGPADLKVNAAGVAKVSDAKDVLGLLDEVDALLPKSTGSYGGAAADAVMGAFGGSTQGAQTVAQLKALQGALVSKMPKMSGPQSDKDVLLYREMAGQVGDQTIPVPQRQAASAMIRKLNEKYAGMPAGSSKNQGASGSWAPPPGGVVDFGSLK